MKYKKKICLVLELEYIRTLIYISVLPAFDTNQMKEYQHLKNKLNEILLIEN